MWVKHSPTMEGGGMGSPLGMGGMGGVRSVKSRAVLAHTYLQPLTTERQASTKLTCPHVLLEAIFHSISTGFFSTRSITTRLVLSTSAWS